MNRAWTSAFWGESAVYSLSIGPRTHRAPRARPTQMPKPRFDVAVQVVPTPMEEELGEVWDPRGHEQQIAGATEVLHRFCDDVNGGRVPIDTLVNVRQAFGVLGHFSGYPEDAYLMECFLESEFAESSYRLVAKMLPEVAEQLNKLIQARSSKLNEVAEQKFQVGRKLVNDDDLPF